LQINKNKIGVSALLILILMIFGGQSYAQTKYNFQVTGGYSASVAWNVNGFNIDFSLNRHNKSLEVRIVKIKTK